MALQRAVVIGSENILETFKLFADGECTYSVWYGPHQKYFQPPNKYDYDEAVELLEKFVSQFEAANDSTLYSIRIHSPNFKGDVIAQKTPYIADFQFRPVELPEEAKRVGIVAGMPHGFQNALQELNGLPAMIKEQQEEIAELRAELDDRDREPTGILGALNGMVKTEQFQTAVLGLISKFVAGNQPAITLNGMGEQPYQQSVPQKAHTNVDIQDLDNTLVRLSQHINLNSDLKKLADYLDKNPGNVPMILDFFK